MEIRMLIIKLCRVLDRTVARVQRELRVAYHKSTG